MSSYDALIMIYERISIAENSFGCSVICQRPKSISAILFKQ